MRIPVDNFIITSAYGYRHDPFNPSEMVFHDGIDFKSAIDNKVFTPRDCQVTYDMDNYDDSLRWTDKHHSGGNMVIVDFQIGNTLFHMRFLHLIDNLVRQRQELKEGDLIGHYGDVGRSKGPHLHNDLYITSTGTWAKINIENFYKTYKLL